MKTTIYELLGMVKDKSGEYKYVKYFDRVKEIDAVMWACKENIIYKLDHSNIELNDEVEILEEPKGIPKKLKSLNNVGNVPNLVEFADKQQLNNHLLKDKLNEIIDYLESKGE